jgi:hypothetical protein
MNCKKVKTLLIDLAETRAENSLSEGTHQGNTTNCVHRLIKIREVLIQRHLNRCDECRKELEHIEKVRQELREMRAPELTDIAWENFQEELSSRLAHIEQLQQPRHFPMPKLILATGAAFALFLLLVLARQLTVAPAKDSSLAKGKVQSALPQEQVTPESGVGINESSELSLADLSAEEIDNVINDAALLSDEEWNEVMASMSDSMIASWDIEDEVDALSLEECDEMLERLEST